MASLAGCGEGAGPPRGTPRATPAAAPTVRAPADARALLEAGNARFAAGRSRHPRRDEAAREAVVVHQHPWALVHGCVDSRVTPELVFDQGIGDLFATRTAGAVLDDTIVGSMEFAVSAPYAVPLIVVLGHTGCGAVTAAANAVAANRRHPSAPGEVVDIVREIAPVVRTVPMQADPAAYVDAVVRASTVTVAEKLVRRSAIIRAAVDAGRTQVVPAVYDLGTGRVVWNPEP